VEGNYIFLILNMKKLLREKTKANQQTYIVLLHRRGSGLFLERRQQQEAKNNINFKHLTLNNKTFNEHEKAMLYFNCFPCYKHGKRTIDQL
jgi:hypothetical protein